MTTQPIPTAPIHDVNNATRVDALIPRIPSDPSSGSMNLRIRYFAQVSVHRSAVLRALHRSADDSREEFRATQTLGILDDGTICDEDLDVIVDLYDAWLRRGIDLALRPVDDSRTARVYLPDVLVCDLCDALRAEIARAVAPMVEAAPWLTAERPASVRAASTETI